MKEFIVSTSKKIFGEIPNYELNDKMPTGEKLKAVMYKIKESIKRVFSRVKTVHLIIFAAILLAAGFGVYVYQRPDPSNQMNTTIVKATGAYAYQNTTNEFQTQFKENPTDAKSIVFSNKLGNISFYTPADQSFGKINSNNPPVADGSTLTYPEIFPGIDLKYTITSSRLLEEFIVQDATVAGQISRIEQRAQTKNTYVANDDGSITFYNKDKEVFTLPHPVMYETGNRDNKSEGIVYEIKKDGDQLIITKVITEEGLAWLADPQRLYPIAIDLVIDNGDTSSNWVSSDPTITTVSQETTIKQEGSGSVKVQTTAGGAPVDVDLMEYASDGAAQASYVSSFASGGTITTSGAYRIHKFTASGTFTPLSTTNIEALVIAGGGGGGESAAGWSGPGGGGAGGYLYIPSSSVNAQGYSIVVGGGGAGNTGQGAGGNGGNSSFNGNTAIGGGGGGAGGLSNGISGGSGGGGAYDHIPAGGGTSGQGNAGGLGTRVEGYPYNGGSGGGAGGAGNDGSTVGPAVAITGGAGIASSISGSSVTYSTGGGTNLAPTHGAANTGNGGGGGGYGGGDGGNGGSGIVIIRYLAPLLSYSDMIRTQGTYALKGVANQTTSLNKTLTRTITSPVNLSDKPSVTFDIRASRTGSNIKVGLHDTGGTTTEVTPNITSANTFQSATIDLSGVTNANKDAIDQIIITVVNADATNTFYLDNMVATTASSVNDTVTRSTAATDLSTVANITYWVRSTVAGSYATFGFGETAATEQTQSITINEANTWEQKSWNIESISGASRNAVTKFAFTFTGDTSGASFYFDDIQTNALFAPTLGTATGLSDSSIRWNFTDNSSEETGFKIYDADSNLLVTCASANLTYCDETGLAAPNTQYTRKIGAYNASFTSIASGTVSGYTLAAVPNAPVVSSRAATTVSVNPDPAANSAPTVMAIYKETGTTCDGSGGSYLAANGSDNGATAVWQTDAAWATVTVTGLNSEQQYAFCVKARNADNAETSFGSTGLFNAAFVPISGDFVVTANTSFTSGNRYVDGADSNRYVIGVDSGSGTTNSGVLEVRSGILTVNTNETVVAGSFTLTGGSIAIANGGVLKVGAAVWAIDADNDGYISGAKLYYGAQPAGGKRKYLFSTLANTNDCNDANASLYRSVAGYLDSDGDGYGAGAYTTCAGASGSYIANASDCDDTNTNIKTKNATGGTKSYISGDIVHTFTSSGTFTFTCGGTATVQTLVVAGGGGGGRSKDGWGGSGGGGAGGYLYNSSLAVTTQSYSVTVGGGGGGGAGGAAGGAGANGGNSVFSTITATGGGGGGAGGVSYGTTGGSGGGGAYYYIYGGSGTAGQGNGGGTGLDVNVSPYNGGSGGGAGGAGRNGNTVGVAVALAGGAGVANSISGSSVTYSVGGSTNIATTHGAANTGNGGSGEYGSGYNGGNGGSGVVIIRYASP